MIRHDADVAVLGAGFSGSLTALILHRLGRRVVLVEKGAHPRFALGESSTPLANLTLAELSRAYDLPHLLPLAKYGTWKCTYPHMVCGPKRGFTFMAHPTNEPFVGSPEHGNELLVTASPADEVADTHWLRSDFDHFVVREAVAAGVPYLDRTNLHLIEPGARWRMKGERQGEGVDLSAAFVIDATGPAGAVARALHIDSAPETVRTNSWAVFNHFVGVQRWETVLAERGGRPADHPYRCDDAALHHVFADGWMYVLRFDNGLTSAGFLLDGEKSQPRADISPEEEWQTLLDRHPAVSRQFRDARPVLPWMRTSRLQRRVRRTAGENWALLAPSAYTLDALYSTGNAHALLTIQRLARLFEREWGRDLREGLAAYDEALQREMRFLDMLVHGSYRAFGRFRLLAAFTMYYFAGAISSEERRKQGRAGPNEEFLSSHLPDFRAGVERGYRTLLGLCSEERPDVEGYERQVARDIAPWNTVGLCDPAKRNLYPYD
jgi:FADH2 O2-dependent halogenase